jgi:hypothetical protein
MGADWGSAGYTKPTITDYGSLVDLTLANAVADYEDGIGKVINTDGSNSFIP